MRLGILMHLQWSHPVNSHSFPPSAVRGKRHSTVPDKAGQWASQLRLVWEVTDIYLRCPLPLPKNMPSKTDCCCIWLQFFQKPFVVVCFYFCHDKRVVKKIKKSTNLICLFWSISPLHLQIRCLTQAHAGAALCTSDGCNTAVDHPL